MAFQQLRVVTRLSIPTTQFSAADDSDKVLVIGCSDGRFYKQFMEWCRNRFSRFATMCLAGGPGNFNEYLTGAQDDLDIRPENLVRLIRERKYTKLALVSHTDCGFYGATMRGHSRCAIQVTQGHDLSVLAYEVAREVNIPYELWYQDLDEKQHHVVFQRLDQHETFVASTRFENKHAKAILISDVYSSTSGAIEAFIRQHYGGLNVDAIMVQNGVPGIVDATRNVTDDKTPMNLWNLQKLIALHENNLAILIDAPRPDQHADHCHARLEMMTCWLKKAFPGITVHSWVLGLPDNERIFELVEFTCDNSSSCDICRLSA